MEGCSRNRDTCPQLVDFIAAKGEWNMKDGRSCSHLGSSEEKKLELRLAPPGQDWSRERDGPGLRLGYNNNGAQRNRSNNNHGGVCLSSSPWASSDDFLKTCSQPRLSVPVMGNESSQQSNNNTRVADKQTAEKKAFLPSSAAPTAAPNTSQKRSAPAPVVGWPPIRSFRKNLGYSKPTTESQNASQTKAADEKPSESLATKGMFVKINMDGIPIGRKVDLKAYDSYEKLSTAVDNLFRGLLAAQSDSTASGVQGKAEEEKPIVGLLDGSGEYTLVYEDNEGDRMLVGDVPWQMFVSAVKRLRVLRSSELQSLSLCHKQ